MTELPSGTVTFLFTDLEGSTRLWEEQPEGMRVAMARHDGLVRSAIEAHRGYVVKTTGDGFHAAFATASDAVEAAVAAQLVLGAEDWPLSRPLRVRIGMHVGVAEIRDGDYYGAALNRAARLMAVAHGGQIVCSQATADLARDALPEDVGLVDLGEHRLRDLLRAERVFQVDAPGLERDFPQLVSIDTFPGGVSQQVPVPATTFVGRVDEIVALVDLIREHRFVTLAGAGGCGKTRLAIELVHPMRPSFADGVVFVDLASVTDDERVGDAVADALGMVSSDAPDTIERLAAYVAGRSLLVILDNCEHLLDATALLVGSILARGGDSHILATSREPIAVPGEHVYAVRSLVADTDGVHLFAERAAEASAGFTVDDTNRDAIVEICARLDGIPLAIELAAATVRHLSPVQIVERLDDRFHLLTGGRRRVQRHQTLAAALDWSYDLLSEAERTVLRRLAVFPATFSLEAAEYVVDRADTIEILGALVNKSLVNAISARDRLRYRLLESVRLYVEPKLVDAEESRTFRARQRDWVLRWLESIPLEERWFGDRDLLGTEHANLRAALDWSTAANDHGAIAGLASGVDWARSDGWRDGHRRCLEALSNVVIGSELQLQVSMMLWWLGPIDVSVFDRALGERLIASLDRMGDPSPLQALALTGGGRDLTIPTVAHSDDALATRVVDLVEAGVDLSERFSEGWRKVCRLNAGMAYTSLSRVDQADDHFAAGTGVSPDRAPFRLLHSALEGYLAITRLLLGHVDDAVSLAHAANERIGPVLAAGAFPYWLHSPGIALPVALGEAGDHAAARDALAAYHLVQMRMDFGDNLRSVTVMGGVLAAQREDWPTASLLLSAGASRVARTPADYLLYKHYRNRVRAALPADRARALRAEGRAMAIDDAVALALA